MKRSMIVVSLLVSSVVMAGVAYQMPSYDDFDTNKNGKVTQKEFEQAQQERMKKQADSGKMMRNAGNAPTFSDMDTNHDGVLSKSEFQKHQQERMQTNSQQRNSMGQGMGQGMGKR
jgi:hypothetical protein